MLSPKENKKKPYHLLNEFEKATRNLVAGLRQEIKADALQATLFQYMKENREKKEQQKLTEFCQELMAQQQSKQKKEMDHQQKLQAQRRHAASSQQVAQKNRQSAYLSHADTGIELESPARRSSKKASSSAARPASGA